MKTSCLLLAAVLATPGRHSHAAETAKTKPQPTYEEQEIQIQTFYNKQLPFLPRRHGQGD